MVASRRTDNLPAPLTTFVGRLREVGEIGASLERSRLVTLTGVGGAGKSRLALEVAARRTARHRDGVWLVELAGLVEPVLVAHTVAGVLDVPEHGGRVQTDVLTERLRDSDMLICLDNCEHLLDPVAQLVQDLLAGCRGLRVLITSRERLGVTGERLWPVAGLSSPPEGDEEAGTAQRFDAVRLFLDRATAADPGFRLTAENVLAVADICRRLDGLPLAIELAAARVNSLGVERISRRLDNRFGLLTAESRTPLPHHRTLRGVVEWSYRMLSAPERELFDRLAVFSGSFGAESAEAVAGGSDGSEDVAELLPRLIDKSLVTVTPVRGSPRYRLLETLRAYGLERLVDTEGLEPLRARHAAYYLDLAEQAWEGYRGPEQPEWLNRLETEHSNLRAALDWQLATHDIDGAIRLAGALAPFWDLRGHYAEGHVWLERALTADAATATEGRVRALNGLATLAVIEGDLSRATHACTEAVELSRRTGDLRGLAYALQYLGFAAVCADDLDRAVDLLDESLMVARKSADLWLVGWSYQFLTAAQLARNDFERARALAEAAYTTLQETGEPESLAWAALTHAMATWALGGSDNTVTRLAEALRRFWGLKAGWGLSEVFCLAGLIAADHGSWERGAGLLGASESLRDSVGVALVPFVREFMAAVAAEGRVTLGIHAFDAAWERGRQWSLDARALAVTKELGLLPLPPYDGEETVQAIDIDEPPSDGAGLRREGEYWIVTHGHQVFHLKDTLGLGYLNRLLHEPDREVLALDLAGAGPESAPGDAGPVLDSQAKAEYRNRLRELADDLDEAERWSDTGRAERARSEIDALTEQLAGAVGLGGRDRRAASATERARLNVTKALKSAVRRIAREDPVLGRHLDRSVRTGTYCCYAPDPRTRIAWRF
ncbi:ATP-binding protein [Streptomyces prunicolor]|uniref:ATP-binding protein n=1 Tax=Streptomyces prunicolor TaxID=67348 RepID=UPI0034464D0D